ncbi:MAG: putative Lipoprotein [Frankiales bacterium]|nr:putative Lipoprotein [Frankiales bacterium]
MNGKALVVASVITAFALSACSKTAAPSDTATPVASASTSASVTATPSPSSTATGLAALSGPEVMKQAAAALRKAGGARATGSMTFLGGSPSTFTARFARAAAELKLSYKGSPMTLISSADGTYLKAPASVWKGQPLPAEAIATLADKWVKLPQVPAGNTNLSLDSLADEFEKPTDAAIEPAVTTTTYKGKTVVVVKQDNGSVAYVATDGSALPVYFANKGQDDSKVSFTSFGPVGKITVPTGALDLGQLTPN